MDPMDAACSEFSPINVLLEDMKEFLATIKKHKVVYLKRRGVSTEMWKALKSCIEFFATVRTVLELEKDMLDFGLDEDQQRILREARETDKEAGKETFLHYSDSLRRRIDTLFEYFEKLQAALDDFMEQQKSVWDALDDTKPVVPAVGDHLTESQGAALVALLTSVCCGLIAFSGIWQPVHKVVRGLKSPAGDTVALSSAIDPLERCRQRLTELLKRAECDIEKFDSLVHLTKIHVHYPKTKANITAVMAKLEQLKLAYCVTDTMLERFWQSMEVQRKAQAKQIELLESLENQVQDIAKNWIQRR